MARNRFDAKNMIQRVQHATQGLVESDLRRGEEAAQERVASPSTWPISGLKERPGGDTRLLHPDHVLDLAESIAALGLLEPLVIDAEGHLLAGGHRLAACRLLAPQRSIRAAARKQLLALASPRQRPRLETSLDELEQRLGDGFGLESDQLPVRLIDFRASDDPDRALAIEATENGQRRDYTRGEVVQLYRRLLDAGYTDRPGKPRPGERPARPLVATVIGRSVRTVRRLLAEPTAEAPVEAAAEPAVELAAEPSAEPSAEPAAPTSPPLDPEEEARVALLELERSLHRTLAALHALREEEPGVEKLFKLLQAPVLREEVRFLLDQLEAVEG